MKKIFTILFLAFSVAGVAQTPFLQTSVIVYRVGDGLAPLRGVGTKVFLDEYSATTGTLVQSVALPTAAAGSNLALTASGSSTSEGSITRSVDGSYLLFAGYNSDTGIDVKTASATAIPRVVARVNALGAINISTNMGTGAFSANNVRTVASVDGSHYWAAGANSGIRYGAIGDTSTRVTSATTTANFRALEIFNGQLYASSTSGSTKGILKIGTGLPTDSGNAAITLLPGLPSTSSPYQFLLLDLSTTIPGPDVLYIADDGAFVGIDKYSFDGTNWISNGSLLPPVSGTRGLAGGIVTGSIVGLVTTTPSKLYSLVDASGYNQPISGTFTELATAATNTAFRGVALAPIANFGPLKLISFQATLLNNKVNLNWTSANEVNVRNFAIERSKDGITYTQIGTVNAKNLTEATYVFSDKSIWAGTTYYRLKMNDNNGSFTYSNVATVSSKGSIKTEVFPNPATNNISVSHSKAASGASITISTMTGQIYKRLNVEAGTVQTSIALDNLVSGNYIVTFNNNGEKTVASFVKQ